MQPGPVRLADRSRGQRRRIEIREQRLQRLFELRLDRLAHDLRLVARHARLQLLQFLRERHADLVGPRAQNLPELDERRPQLFDRHPNPRLAAQMGELLAIAILQEALHQREIEPAHPIRQPVLAEYREDLAPAIHIAIDVGDGGDFHGNCRTDNPVRLHAADGQDCPILR